ncbi:MAG: hypothetical protein HYZ17_06640 [Betaproteobacteria bacterium]|nr:hypothetical protein [Betaproteobacteria bacterium]
MRPSIRSLSVSLGVFVALLGTIAFVAYMTLTEQTPSDAIESLQEDGRLALYRHGLIEKLSPADTRRLYQQSCTRRCHGKDVIEKGPRTAAEWEAVMARMKAPDRAALDDRRAEAITRHLQNHFLSNVPTVLPPATMKFVKQHLWRSDFGESDLFLDIIYVPTEHARLLPYLGVRKTPGDAREALFIVYINTHQGRVPQWDLAAMSSLRLDQGAVHTASGWQILYRDGQQHHDQGLLSFPVPEFSGATELKVVMRLAGLGTRTFQWNLPIPPLPE